jgi:hypothetical protein
MGQQKLNRRDFLRIGVAAVGGASLAACGASPPQANQAAQEAATAVPAEPTTAPAEGQAAAPTTNAPPPTEAGTIAMWVFWNQYAEPAKAFTPALLEKIKPNKIDIRTGVDAEQVFLPAIAAGTPPDIGTGYKYVDYMSKGQAVPIDDFVASSQVIKKENFSEANWQGTFWEGKQYGISAIEAFVRRGLNYNARLVQEAGLDPDKPPETWTELMEWHDKLTKFDSAGNLIQIGIDPFDAEGGVFASDDGSFLADSWGFDWYDPNTKKFNLNNEQMVAGLTTMSEFIKKVGAEKLSGMRSVEGQGTWGTAFNAEVQAMIIEGYWHPGETAHEKPEVSKNNRTTWIPVPDNRRGKKIQFGGGHMVFIYKGSKNAPEQVWPVAEFLNSDEHNDPVFKTIGWLPAYIPFIEKADPKAFPGLDFYFNSVKEANEWHYPIRNQIMSFVERKFTETIEQVYRGQMGAEQAAQELQSAAEQEWKEAGFAT